MSSDQTAQGVPFFPPNQYVMFPRPDFAKTIDLSIPDPVSTLRKAKQGDLIQFQWHDAWAISGWESLEEVIAGIVEPVPIRTVGYALDVNDDWLLVSGSMAVEVDGTPQVLGCHAVPLAWIVSARIVEPSDG